MIQWERKAAQATETCIGRCDLCKLVCLYDFASYLIDDVEFGCDWLEAEARRHWGLRRRSDGVDVCSTCRKNGRWHQSPSGKVTRSGGFTVTWTSASADLAKAMGFNKYDRFRAAMQGMANVMRNVQVACVEKELDVGRYAHLQRRDMSHELDGKLYKRERLQAAWSERVREGVKALRTSGPVVAC